MAKRASKKSAKSAGKRTMGRGAAKPAQARPSNVKPTSGKASGAVLLSGDNPQIAKGYGDAPVQAWIAAIPGWKRPLAARLDALISRAVPKVSKAVKWNSPLYGMDGSTWFMSLHCFTRYVKVAFFRGRSLQPLPPGESKHKQVRYLDVHEDDEFDEARFTKWVKQASRLPGEKM